MQQARQRTSPVIMVVMTSVVIMISVVIMSVVVVVVVVWCGPFMPSMGSRMRG